MAANGSSPGVLGAGLVQANPTTLAQLDITGMTLGTEVYVVSLGVDFVLTLSSAPLSSTVIAVAGFPTLRWISDAPALPVATGFWAGFAFAAINPSTGSDANCGFGTSKANALVNAAAGMPGGPLKTFAEFYRRLAWQAIGRITVNLYGTVPETDSTIPPPTIFAAGRFDGTPNGITIIGEPTVLATVTLTPGTSGFDATNKKSIVEATGLTGSWTLNAGQRLVSLFDTQGARFLRSHSALKTAPILSDLGSKRASIGWPCNVDTSLPFATGARAADFVSGEVCDVIGLPIVPDASPGLLPMSYQDVEFSRADRRNFAAFIVSRGNLYMACCASTSSMWFYGASQVLWSGCLTSDPVKISSCPNVDIRQPALLGNGVITTLDWVTGGATNLGITDWASQGAVGYFSNGTTLRAIGDARVFDLDAASLATFIGAFSADGPTKVGLNFSSVRGAIQQLTWAIISNSMADMRGVAASTWTGTNTFADQWYAMAESASPHHGAFSALPFVGDNDHFGACIVNGFN
jgi:hypothetical protein